MTKQKSLKKNAAIYFVKAFMNIIFPIISFPYASRILMPEGIGKVNFANSFIEYFLMIAVLGINNYAAREAAKIRDDRRALSLFSREILGINAVSTVTAYILLVTSLFIVGETAPYRILLIICSTKILFTTLGMEWLFMAEEEFSYVTVRQAAFQVLSLALLFSLVRTPDDYYIYAAIGVFANVGSNVFNFIYSRRFINLLEKGGLHFARHIRPVLTFFGTSVASKINNALDSVMLGFMVGDAAVGFYSAALKLSRMVIELITSSITTIMPRSSYYVAEKRMDEYRDMVSKVFRTELFFALPATAGLLILCRPLMLIFSGERYLPAIPSMQILSIGIVANCTSTFFNHVILTPNRKEKYILVAQIIGAVANILLNAVLIPRYGVLGASLATVFLHFLIPSVMLTYTWRFIRTAKNALGAVKSLAGSAVMYLCIWFLFKDIQSNALQIALSVVTGAAVYALCEIILKNEIALMILDMLRKRISKR